jgi:hypothetical protein
MTPTSHLFEGNENEDAIQSIIFHTKIGLLFFCFNVGQKYGDNSH